MSIEGSGRTDGVLLQSLGCSRMEFAQGRSSRAAIGRARLRSKDDRSVPVSHFLSRVWRRYGIRKIGQMGINSHSFFWTFFSSQMYGTCPSSRAQTLRARGSGSMRLRASECRRRHISPPALERLFLESRSTRTSLQDGLKV